MRSGRLATWGLALFLAGCSSTISTTGRAQATAAPPATLPEARALWQQQDVAEYEVTVQMSCYCPQDLVQPIRLSVQAGKVVAAEGLEQPLENLTQEGASRLTIEGLFAFIREAREREAHVLQVSYDSRYGFPVRIDYDGHPMIADDERQYRLSDFKAGSDR